MLIYLIHMVQSNIPYSGEKCQYTNRLYKDKCSCPSHRRDRQYYDIDNNEPLYRFARSNSYETLKIQPPAEYDKVRRAYRKMSLSAHPDKGGSTERFIEVKQAYDDLMLLC